MPFQVSTTNPELADFGSFMKFLLEDVLLSYMGLRVMAPEAVSGEWRDMQDEGPWASADRLRLAARFGAGLVLEGTVAESDGQVRVTTLLRRAPGGEVLARDTVQSSLDSMRTSSDSLYVLPWALVRRMVNSLSRLVAVDSRNLAAERLEALLNVGDEARDQYGRAVRALSDSQYEVALIALDRALGLDSTFALAAMGMISAGCALGPNSNDAWLLGAQAAWNHRENLPERDRALLLSLVGNYPVEPLRAASICP